jgi:HSP20 family protein
MAKEKRSFFERLTGSVKLTDDHDDAPERELHVKKAGKHASEIDTTSEDWIEEESKDAELTVDVYQNAEMILIKAMIAGVRPEDLDVSITRDSVTIKGHREEERAIREEDYFIRELYWGSFSRTIALPEEIDVDEAEAVDQHGLLILKLPKFDKGRQAKLKVKTI